MMRSLSCLLFIALATQGLLAFDPAVELERLKTLVAALPEPAVVEPASAEFPEGMKEMSDGIHLGEGVVVLAGHSLVDKGPVDGLEVLCCLKGGKNHESFMRLDSSNGQLVKGACMIGLELPDEGGMPADEGSALPARGVPVSLQVLWIDDPLVDKDAWVSLPASSLVTDRVTNRAYPELPFVYTGSRIRSIEQPDENGKPVTRNHFMLDTTKSLAVNYDEPDALFASPFPLAVQDDLFEANGKVAPAPDSTVYLVLRPCVLPLSIALAADGALTKDDQVLDDAGLANALQAAYAKPGGMRAVGVLVTADVPREQDAAARARILAAAAQASVWVTPTFVMQ